MIIFLFDLIHEGGHLLVANLFKIPIKSLKLHIYGFSLEIDDISYYPCLKQLFFYGVGPLSFFVSYGFLIFLLNISAINYYQYRTFYLDNLSLALFNLLPLFPLDGGRLISILYYRVCDIKKAIKYQFVFSLLSYLLVFIVVIKYRQYLLALFFIITFVLYIKGSRKMYLDYLINRLSHDIDFPPKINSKKEIYHFYHNYYFADNRIIEEKPVITSLINEGYNRKMRLNIRKKYLSKNQINN